MSKIKLSFSNPIAKEYRWFAWRPVSTADRGWRWLVPVYKRKYLLHSWLDTPGYTPKPFFMYAVEKGVLG